MSKPSTMLDTLTFLWDDGSSVHRLSKRDDGLYAINGPIIMFR